MRMLVSGGMAREIMELADVPGLELIHHDGVPDQADLAQVDAWCGLTPLPQGGLHQLRWIHTGAAGPNSLLTALRGGHTRDLIVTRTVGAMPQRAAAHALAAWLPERLDFPQYAADQRHRRWQPADTVDITDTAAAILGTGGLGCGVARAFAALGVRTIGVNSTGTPVAGFDEVVPLGTARALPRPTARALAGVDVVISTLPATPETEAIVSDAFLGALRGAYLINVGRGATLDEAALARALDDGTVRGATLDVFSPEPPPADSWLWGDERVRITPHTAAITTAADVAESLSLTWRQMQAGEPLSLQIQLDRGY